MSLNELGMETQNKDAGYPVECVDTFPMNFSLLAKAERFFGFVRKLNPVIGEVEVGFGKVGADEVGSRGEGLVAAGCFIGPSFAGAAIRSSADEISFA